jgi:hypothetical protein
MFALSVVALGITACRTDTTPITPSEIAETSTPSQTTPGVTEPANHQAPTETSPYNELSPEEAATAGVLTGKYDALLVGPESVAENADGCLEVYFILINVGNASDVYKVSSRDDVISFDHDEITLDPQQSQLIVATKCDQTSEEFIVEVHSEGFGDLIARFQN